MIDLNVIRENLAQLSPSQISAVMYKPVRDLLNVLPNLLTELEETRAEVEKLKGMVRDAAKILMNNDMVLSHDGSGHADIGRSFLRRLGDKVDAHTTIYQTLQKKAEEKFRSGLDEARAEVERLKERLAGWDKFGGKHGPTAEWYEKRCKWYQGELESVRAVVLQLRESVDFYRQRGNEKGAEVERLREELKGRQGEVVLDKDGKVMEVIGCRVRGHFWPEEIKDD